MTNGAQFTRNICTLDKNSGTINSYDFVFICTSGEVYDRRKTQFTLWRYAPPKPPPRHGPEFKLAYVVLKNSLLINGETRRCFIPARTRALVHACCAHGKSTHVRPTLLYTAHRSLPTCSNNMTVVYHIRVKWCMRVMDGRARARAVNETFELLMIRPSRFKGRKRHFRKLQISHAVKFPLTRPSSRFTLRARARIWRVRSAIPARGVWNITQPLPNGDNNIGGQALAKTPGWNSNF